MPLNRRALAAGLGILLALGGFAAPVRAEQVGPDPAFGDGGAVTIDFAGDFDQTANLVLQPNGKIVVAGSAVIGDDSDLVVTRLNADGALDPDFGDGGVVLADSGGWDQAEVIALQPDGKLLLAGALGGTSLVRLNSDGSIDRTFGTNGLTSIPQTSVSALTLQADGGIVVAGYTNIDSTRQSDAAVSRFLPSGALDTSFGTGGSTVVDIGSSPGQTHEESLEALRVFDDGSLFAVGRHVANYGTGSPFDALLLRLTPAGGLDTGFNGTGYRLYRPGAHDFEGWDVLADSAGRAVVSMRPSTLARFLPNGALDTTFGSGGHTTGPSYAVLARDRDGRIIAAGGGTTYRVERFSADGHTDLSFHGGGFETKIAPYSDFPTGVTVQPDGRLLIAGFGFDVPDGSLPGGRTNADWTIQRLSFAPDPPTSPSPPPTLTTAGDQSGYWMLRRDGAVYGFGAARRFGDAALSPGREAVDLEPGPDNQGYWIVDDVGAVFAFGHARWLGGNPTLAARETVTSLSATPDGQGYWLFTSAGRVHPYGQARSFGDMTGTGLNGPVLDSVPTPSGDGYYMVASDGGIFAFGDARFAGSMGGTRLNAPVQSLVPDGDGAGYWLVAADGGIFAFDALFNGSMGGTPLNKPVTGMVRYGNGYLMVGEDGGIFSFSDRPFSGSLGGQALLAPIVSVAALG